MRSLLLTFVFGAFIAYGIQLPFILILGYVWVDIFTPQKVAYGLLTQLPVSLIMALLISVMFIANPKRERLGNQPVVWLIFIFACWMTLTLLWAEVPQSALGKWDWAFKAVVFTCVVPFFIRGKLQVEAFLWTVLISGMGHCIPYGVKVLFSGGGYGVDLGIVADNTGYGEGSTLAMFAVTLVPIATFLYKHQSIFPQTRLIRVGLALSIFASLLASVGTFARTGLLSSAMLALRYFFSTRRKLLYIIVAISLAPILYYFAGDQWEARMTTIGDGTDASAMGRVAVWKWTTEYVATHPLGGSFNVYLIGEYMLDLIDGTTLAVRAKAFHSAYFEILGELGIPGLFLYLSIVGATWINLKRTIRFGKLNSDEWLMDAAKALLTILYVYLVGSAFIGVGFQSYIYYIAVLSVSLMATGGMLARRSKY